MALKVNTYLNFKHSSKGYFPLIRPSLGKKANEQAGELSGHYSLGTGGLPCKGQGGELWSLDKSTCLHNQFDWRALFALTPWVSMCKNLHDSTVVIFLSIFFPESSFSVGNGKKTCSFFLLWCVETNFSISIYYQEKKIYHNDLSFSSVSSKNVSTKSLLENF